MLAKEMLLTGGSWKVGSLPLRATLNNQSGRAATAPSIVRHCTQTQNRANVPTIVIATICETQLYNQAATAPNIVKHCTQYTHYCKTQTQNPANVPSIQ